METAITAFIWILAVGAILTIVGMIFAYVTVFKTKKKVEKFVEKRGEKIVEDLEAAARKKLDEIGKK